MLVASGHERPFGRLIGARADLIVLDKMLLSEQIFTDGLVLVIMMGYVVVRGKQSCNGGKLARA